MHALHLIVSKQTQNEHSSKTMCSSLQEHGGIQFHTVSLEAVSLKFIKDLKGKDWKFFRAKAAKTDMTIKYITRPQIGYCNWGRNTIKGHPPKLKHDGKNTVPVCTYQLWGNVPPGTQKWRARAHVCLRKGEGWDNVYLERKGTHLSTRGSKWMHDLITFWNFLQVWISTLFFFQVHFKEATGT